MELEVQAAEVGYHSMAVADYHETETVEVGDP